MTVLLITYSQDNESVSLVNKAIESKGEEIFRFDTDRFPTEIELEIYYSQGKEIVILTDGEKQLRLDEVSAVWYRRIAMGERIPQTMDVQLRSAAVKESTATIQGAIASIRGFHLDPLPYIRLADNKQLQLQVAKEMGLDIPRTLITNNPQAVRQFYQECDRQIVAKMLSSFAIYDEKGRDRVVFTNPVKSEDLDSLDRLRYCPMTFQEKIDKSWELRATVVGKRVFTAAIDSQRYEGASYDWRRRGLATIKDWQRYDLPEEIELKLLQLMAYFQLNYGAIDMILTPDDRYVFLEVNPVGEFFWLEKYSGLPISEAIAELLLSSSVDIPKS